MHAIWIDVSPNLTLVGFAKAGVGGRLTGQGPARKTMMCIYYTEARQWNCKNGDRCTFAHDPSEIGSERDGNVSIVNNILDMYEATRDRLYVFIACLKIDRVAFSSL